MNHQQMLEALKQISFMRFLSEATAESMLREGKTISLEPDDVIFHEGDPGTSMYLILSGDIKIFKKNKEIALRTRGEFFGEMALIDSKPRSAGAKALLPSTLLEIDQKIFNSYLASNYEVILDILKVFSNRTRLDLDTIDWGFKELKRSEELYRNIVETTSDIIIHIDPEGRVEFANSAVRLLGYEPSEMKGRPLSSFVDSSSSNTDLAGLLTRRIGSRSSHNIEVTMKVNENSAVRDDFRTSAMLMDAHGLWDAPEKIVSQKGSRKKFLGSLLIGRNISQRKRFEEKLKRYSEELKRSNSDLEEWAYIASHDLQEPLRKIVTFIDRIESKLPDCEESVLNYLDRTQIAAKRMQRLVEDLLQLSKVNVWRKPPAPVNLKDLANEALQNLEVALSKTKGTVTIESLPVLEAQPSQILQMFQNLISNALKFHRAGIPPVVNIRSVFNPETGNWEIELKDNGIGFHEEQASKIFQPFRRLHGKSSYEGTGMGLAICLKIACRHKGDITVKSKIGQGSIFKVILPEKQPPSNLNL